MKSSRCAFSTAAALHRVFIAPIQVIRPRQSQLQSTRRTVSSSTLQRIDRTPRFIPTQQQKCYASTAAAKSRLPRDDEIRSLEVLVVDENGKLPRDENGNLLLEPVFTVDVLDSMDRKKDSLIVVVPGEPGMPPICKIMNKEAMRAAEKLKAKGARSSVVEKTIELNWAIGGNDLGHRLVKLKGFLEKGCRVDVVLGTKRKGRKASEEEAEELIEKVRKAVGEVEGTRESKPMDGQILGMLTLQFEGKRKKGKKDEEEADAEAVEEKVAQT